MSIPFMQQHNLLYVNVRDYGAQGDGMTDDTAAIQAAIAVATNAGRGTVFFSEGTYLISSSLIIDHANITLMGNGQRDSTIIQVASSADPSYALIVGNTTNADKCLIEGITFVGRNSTSSTGGGINLRSGQGKIINTKVALFGGIGINVGTIASVPCFEQYFQDVDLIQNGMNSTSHNDNLVFNAYSSDSEFHRIICEGNTGKNTTRNGICINGDNQLKFVNCHCYQHSNDGFKINTGTNIQIIGGEYEANGQNGIESAGINVLITTVSCFGNSNVDIAIYLPAIVTGCLLTSSASDNIYGSSSSGGIIQGNLCSNATNAIFLDTGSSLYTVADNILSASSETIAMKSTHSSFHDNILTGAGICELTGADYNLIHDNDIPSGKTIAVVGSHTKIRANQGYNPLGHAVTQPSIPMSTTAQTNTFGVDCTVFITGGTVSAIAIGGTSTGFTSGAFRVPVGQSIAITYSMAPSWQWFGD